MDAREYACEIIKALSNLKGLSFDSIDVESNTSSSISFNIRFNKTVRDEKKATTAEDDFVEKVLQREFQSHANRPSKILGSSCHVDGKKNAYRIVGFRPGASKNTIIIESDRGAKYACASNVITF